MEVFVIYIYIQKAFFLWNVLIYTKSKKINTVYVRIFLKPKYWELSWAIKMEFCIIGKSQ